MTTAPTWAMPLWLRNRWGAVAGAMGVYLLMYSVWVGGLGGGQSDDTLLNNLVFLPMGVWALVAAWARVATNLTLSRAMRRAWWLLGLSSAMLILGDLTTSLIENYYHLSTEQYYFADFFYLAFYPLAVSGLMLLPGTSLRPETRWKFLLDISVVLTAAAMGVWYFVVAPLAAQYQNSDAVTQNLVTAFPVGDFVVLAGVVALFFRRPNPATRSALLLYSIGLLGFVGFDLLNIYLNLSGMKWGEWPSIAWMLAYWCFGLAALRQPYLSRGSRTEAVIEGWFPTLSIVLPFVAIFFGYGMALWQVVTYQPSERAMGVFVGAALLTGLVLGRQMLALRENARLNQELVALSADLEQRVQRRTQELRAAQEALLASQKLASVGALAAGVVHEISNPLNTIITAGEILEVQLENGVPDIETLKVYIPVINRAAWHGAKVMQALRAYSRGGAPALAPHSLTEMVQDTLGLMSYAPQNWHPVRLTLNLPADLPRILCDRHQLAQVLINLLQNAREAMPAGGALYVRARAVPEGVVMEVQDTGEGLTEEAKERLFDPFYTTKAAGSGLGLSIVATIVRAHRGQIEVESAGLGQGATFRVTWPAQGQ